MTAATEGNKVLRYVLDSVSPIGGRLGSLDDTMSGAMKVNEGARVAYEWVFGISFNLDRVLDWADK